MTLSIFGYTNPQPAAYTGNHLQRLERLYNQPINLAIPLATFIFRRIMVVGSLVRMVADSARYTSHAFSECLLNKRITPLALNSLGKSTAHFILAIATLAIGVLSPSSIIKLANRLSLLPQQNSMHTLLSAVKAIAALSIVAGLAYGIAYLAQMTQEEFEATVLTAAGGEKNLKAAGVAVGVFTSCGALYGAIKAVPTIIQMCRYLQYIWIVPYDFAL